MNVIPMTIFKKKITEIQFIWLVFCSVLLNEFASFGFFFFWILWMIKCPCFYEWPVTVFFSTKFSIGKKQQQTDKAHDLKSKKKIQNQKNYQSSMVVANNVYVLSGTLMAHTEKNLLIMSSDDIRGLNHHQGTNRKNP